MENLTGFHMGNLDIVFCIARFWWHGDKFSSPIESASLFPIMRSSEYSLRSRCYRFLFGLIINPFESLVPWDIIVDCYESNIVFHYTMTVWIEKFMEKQNSRANQLLVNGQHFPERIFFYINYFNHPPFGFVNLINLIKTTFVWHFCYQVHKIDKVYAVIERSIELFKRLWFFWPLFLSSLTKVIAGTSNESQKEITTMSRVIKYKLRQNGKR